MAWLLDYQVTVQLGKVKEKHGGSQRLNFIRYATLTEHLMRSLLTRGSYRRPHFRHLSLKLVGRPEVNQLACSFALTQEDFVVTLVGRHYVSSGPPPLVAGTAAFLSPPGKAPTGDTIPQ
jgi:hypothetical protein